MSPQEYARHISAGTEQNMMLAGCFNPHYFSCYICNVQIGPLLRKLGFTSLADSEAGLNVRKRQKNGCVSLETAIHMACILSDKDASYFRAVAKALKHRAWVALSGRDEL